MTTAPAGSHICSYVVKACYDGKTPFMIGTFSVPRADTFHETEAAATQLMKARVDQFFAEHLPDGVPRPVEMEAILGSVTFVPDDFDWRRT